MSLGKTISGLIIIGIVGYGAYLVSQKKSAPSEATPTAAEQAAASNSDETLVGQTAAIDAQMSALDDDNASLNASDKAVTQSY